MNFFARAEFLPAFLLQYVREIGCDDLLEMAGVEFVPQSAFAKESSAREAAEAEAMSFKKSFSKSVQENEKLLRKVAELERQVRRAGDFDGCESAPECGKDDAECGDCRHCGDLLLKIEKLQGKIRAQADMICDLTNYVRRMDAMAERKPAWWPKGGCDEAECSE